VEPYKCLSVRQPLAWLIIMGEKRIENRGRPVSHRGRLLIHSSSNKGSLHAFLDERPGVQLHPSWLAFGAIIGRVQLVDVVEMSADPENDPWGTRCSFAATFGST
jgi:ASCH domain